MKKMEPKSRSWLFDKYILSCMSIKEICTEFGYTHGTIYRWLTSSGIKTRSRGYGAKLWHIKHPGERTVNYYRGGRKLDSAGYMMIMNKEHPNTGVSGYIREHRVVMEKHLGRYLLPTEVVHHIDGNKENNNIVNLLLFPNNSEHMKLEYKIRKQKFNDMCYLKKELI